MTKVKHKSGGAQKASATNLRNFRTFLLMQQFAAREIGARIAQARREADAMTQDELADALNISKRSVQEYEAGNTIPWKHFSRLEEIFGKPLSWFLHGEEEATPPSDAGQLEALLQAEEENARRLDALEGRADRSEGLLEEIRDLLRPEQTGS